MPCLSGYLTRNREEPCKNGKFLRDNEVIVIFVILLNLRKLKSGGNIILSICVVIGLDKAISIMRLQ